MSIEAKTEIVRISAASVEQRRTILGEELTNDLLSNQEKWGVGFDAADNAWWCTPLTADGHQLPTIFYRDWKWSGTTDAPPS